MAHGHAVGHRDGAELARRAAGGGNPLLHCLGLTHQRDIARRGFVPAGGNADKRLMNLLGGQPHGVEVGAMGSARRALSHMTAWQPVLDVGLGVHCNLPPGPPRSLLDTGCTYGAKWCTHRRLFRPTYRTHEIGFTMPKCAHALCKDSPTRALSATEISSQRAAFGSPLAQQDRID